MSFNEQNSVENFIIHHLTGVNLNAIKDGVAKEDPPSYGIEPRWKYVEPDQLVRDISDVMLENELKTALSKLNPSIASNPERAD